MRIYCWNYSTKLVFLPLLGKLFWVTQLNWTNDSLQISKSLGKCLVIMQRIYITIRPNIPPVDTKQSKVTTKRQAKTISIISLGEIFRKKIGLVEITLY